ncbi:magnesium transporter [Candidatus Roizmanbacteria bacterium]|nr:magnesium transporter [Candidatus Roizmanbacteria bacterium]
MPYQRLLRTVDHHLKKKDDRKLKSLLVKKDTHKIAQVIDQLASGKVKVFGLLPPEIQADVALTLSDATKSFVLPRLSDYTLARILHFTEEDDAVDILQFLPHLRREHVIEKLKDDKRKKVEKLLRYHPETAGGLMDLNFIIVSPNLSLQDVATLVQKQTDRSKQAPLVIAIDEDETILGYIPYKNVLFRPPSASVKSLTHPLPTVSYMDDQEKVLEVLLRERSEVVGVRDDNQQILGVIQARDLIRVVQEEATEDVYRFAGVSSEEDTIGTPQDAVRRRYKWLLLNLGTALIASFVVSFFENTIAQMAILAAYMPVVAGLGGNSGTQSLAVVVRGLALGEIAWDNGRRVIAKEMITGTLNGFIVGTAGAVVAALLNQSPLLGVVLGISIVINLTIAGLVGGMIPLVLKRMGIDPAVASSVFVTASTDISGFFIFLGLATLVLL